MSIEVLSSRESATVCRAAIFLVLHHFRFLARRTDPKDLPLTRLFQDLGLDLEQNLVEIRDFEGATVQVAGLAEEQMGQRVARGFLPSLTRSVGDGCLDREAGIYLIECVLGDLSGFFAAMVRQSCDQKARELIQRSKQAVAVRIEFLRKVVL